MSDRATSDTYLGIDITLPSGKMLHCEPLPLSRALYWLEVRGYSELEPRTEDERRLRMVAQLEVLKKFPAEVAPEGEADAFEELLPAEIYELCDRFLVFRRTVAIRGIDAEKAEAMTTTATGASTT